MVNTKAQESGLQQPVSTQDINVLFERYERSTGRCLDNSADFEFTIQKH